MLSTTARQEIDQWITKYPKGQKQSAVLQALYVVQEEQPDRCLTVALMDSVADYLEMPKITVYEVASFYSMFEQQPVGKYKIAVCTSISCQLSKSSELFTHLSRRLNISANETTPDKKFTLKKVGCLGACVGAPVVQINRDYHEHMTPQKIDAVLEQLE